VLPEALDTKIEELQNKHKKYHVDGEEQIKKEKEDLMKYVEIAVEEEMEAEKKAAEAEEEYGYEDHEENKDANDDGSRRQSHRGRGGKFVSDRGDQDGGYFSKFNKKKPRGEFEGSDDEETPDSTYYSKPLRGGGKQVGGGSTKQNAKKNLALDEDNFPTLWWDNLIEKVKMKFQANINLQDIQLFN